MSQTHPEPGERWKVQHYGIPLVIDVKRIGETAGSIFGTLVEPIIVVGAIQIGAVGDDVIVPATAFLESGERVEAE